MEIVANKEVIPFNITDENNLADVLLTLLILTHKADKLIIECVVDGKSINISERMNYAETPLADVKRIEIIVANKSEKAIEIIHEIEKGYPECLHDLNEASNLLLAGQKHKALTLFSQALLNWRKIMNFINIIESAFDLDFTSLEIDGKKVDQSNKELFDLLSLVKNAIENDDVVSIGDLIEYELKPKVEEQQHIVAALPSILRANAEKLKTTVS